MDRLTVIHGDCVEEMRKLPAESVHLWVTSPPYWGLRDYKIPTSVWGGDENCAHEWVQHVKPAANGIIHDAGMSADTLSDRSATRKPQKSDFCSRCNAWRGVFGLEPTPELYLEHAVLIFREAKRVLRKDGTLWVNLGDSYHGAGTTGGTAAYEANGSFSTRGATGNKPIKVTGLKQGDLVGIPWRLALALQADGWYLRRDNIWFKPNPMPESLNGWRWEKHRIKMKVSERAASNTKHGAPDVGRKPHGSSKGPRDQNGNAAFHSVAQYVACLGCEKCAPNGGLILRKGNWRCTTAHEYVFQFSKSDSYFCDAEAAREKSTMRSSGNKSRFVATDGERGRTNNHIGSSFPYEPDTSGRNLRSVWRIPTKPFRAAHFATFPPDLVRPIIAAASPVKCCATCGAPWAPVVERGEANIEQQRACGGDLNGFYNGTATKDFEAAGAEDASAVKARILAGMVHKRVVAYRPTCSCNAAGVPAVVGDMFGGSGTVGQVALELGRAALLIEISAEYQPLIQKRCAVTIGMGL